MKKSISLILFLLCFSGAYAQSENTQLNKQLSEMREYFLAEDYDSFANFTYPKIIEMMGGKQNMVNLTKQAIDGLKAQNISFAALNYADASQIFEKGGELQCTVVQETILNTPNGKIQSLSALIGISKDGGQNWTFIETSGKDKKALSAVFPNLHEDLVIPPSSQKMLD